MTNGDTIAIFHAEDEEAKGNWWTIRAASERMASARIPSYVIGPIDEL